MSDLPEPLLPAEVDLRDFPYMPLHAARLFNSEFHAKASDAEWRAGVTLWLKAFFLPGASLPDDDVQLARLAEFGRDVKAWQKVREGALHGWKLCSDGRLHHPVVAEVAWSSWLRKMAQRDRTEKARAARHRQRQSQNHGDAPTDHATETVTSSVTETVTGSNRREEKGIEGNRDSERETRSPRGARLTPDWTLPDEWRSAAAERRAEFGLPAINLDLEAEKFRNYWHSQSGTKGVKLDWRATWINWALKADRPRGNHEQSTGHRNGFAQLIAEGGMHGSD